MSLFLIAFIAACADVKLAPSVPATLEFLNLPAPAVAIGDTLRDLNGVAAPLKAIVRNQSGEELKDVRVQFVYVDANRDSALYVDTLTGYVVSLKALAATASSARIAARAGATLQSIRNLLIALRPDSISHDGSNTIATLTTTVPDTGTTANMSSALSVTVRHQDSTSQSLVSNWLVKYEVVRPANPTNDSTASVFLVNDARRVSNIDTTDISGIASRFLRVRSAQFPTGTAPDSAVVSVTVSYRGKPIKGAPVLLTVPIVKKQ